MKSFLNTAAATVSLFAATTGMAFAGFGLEAPEPSSITLVGLGIGAAVYFLKRKNK